MLPVPPPTETDRQPVNRDFNNYDSLIQELNEPKEQMIKTAPGGNGINQSGYPADGFSGTSAVEPIPAEIAALSGKTIAGTIDTGLGFGLSVYAKNRTPEKYRANDEQRQQLERAWAAVAQKYNYKVEDSPWFNVMLLNVFVYFPAFQEAQTDRRFALQDEKNREFEAKQKEFEARLNSIEPKPVA